MAELPTNGEEDLADGIFGLGDYEAPRPLKKNFLPWHKPRKQFVRQHQWCKQVNLLLAEINPGGDTLRYLGLPGNDLLDLRHFHTHVCQPNNMRLRFLGFNSGANPRSEAQTELNISLDEVKKLSSIDHLSEIIWDDFCLVADENSRAWHKAKDFGPYDIINLDLCDGFGAHKPGEPNNTHYNALARLLSLQMRSKTPWLLFLTTRTGKQDIHVDVLAKLQAKYKQNLVDCDPFKQASIQFMDISDEVTLDQASNTPDGHLEVFLVGLCKWLLGLAVGLHPPSIVEVKSTIGYRINDAAGHDDLVSIALKFEPTFVPANDPLGIVGHQAALPSECDLAVKILKRVKRRICADKILEESEETLDAMVEATAKLLKLARYDVDAFYAWLQAD